MNFTYLPRQRSLESFTYEPAAQLINVPAMLGAQRCPWCRYFESRRSRDDYFACSYKNGCGSESLIWAVLENSYVRRYGTADHFTPTTICRQHYFDQVPRYVQLISCDIEGYQCNSLCQFYPSRITEDKSIAECSNTRRCGRNGSYFQLLTLREQIYYKDLIWNKQETTLHTLCYLDGTVIEDDEIAGWYIDEHQFIRLHTNQETDPYVCCMIPESSACLYVLMAYSENARSYSFSYLASEDRAVYYNAVYFNTLDGYLGTYLQSWGMWWYQLMQPVPNIASLQISAGVTLPFSTEADRISFITQDNGYLVLFKDLDNNHNYCVQLGSSSEYYLMSPRENKTPSTWKKAKPSSVSPSAYGTITITDFTDDFAQWLQSIGVRQSILNIYQ